MEKDKSKKRTLTISSNLKKKIDTSSISSSGKKSYAVEKKKPFRTNKPFNRVSSSLSVDTGQENKKKNNSRKFIEQQATKDFIKKENKPAGKSKLKLKGPVDKRDFKLTISRALNVEEIEIKQRSLASVKRARLTDAKLLCFISISSTFKARDTVSLKSRLSTGPFSLSLLLPAGLFSFLIKSLVACCSTNFLAKFFFLIS